MARSKTYVTVAPCIRKYTAADGSVSYRVQVRLRGRTYIATRDRLKDARAERDRLQAEARSGLLPPSSRYTVAHAIQEYRIAWERGDLGRTLAKRGEYLVWWEERLGSHYLDQVNAPLIVAQLQALQRGDSPKGIAVSPATANRYHSALSAVLTHVASLGWIPHNAARLVRRRPEPASVGRELTTDERTALLEAAEHDEDWRIYPLVALAIIQGARQGELLRLRWPDIDLAQAMAELHKTKSGHKRAMPLFERSVAILRELQRTRRRIDTDHVFGPPGKTGQSPFPRDAWYRVREAAGVAEEAPGRAYRFHGLRHDCACRLARSGASDSEMMEIMGWESRNMVARYTHLRPGFGRAALERAARLVGGDDG